MKRGLLTTCAVLLTGAAITGCGGNSYQGHKFADKAKFESYMKNTIERQQSVTVTQIGCTKTGDTTADCVVKLDTGENVMVTVECGYVDKAGAHDCLYRTAP